MIIKKITLLNEVLTTDHLKEKGYLTPTVKKGMLHDKLTGVQFFKNRKGYLGCKDWTNNWVGSATMYLEKYHNLSKVEIVNIFSYLIDPDAAKAINVQISNKKAEKENELKLIIKHAKEDYLIKYKNKEQYIADVKAFLENHEDLSKLQAVKDYLINTRCLKVDIVEEFIKKGLITAMAKFHSDDAVALFVNINPFYNTKTGYWAREASDKAKKQGKDTWRHCKSGGNLSNFGYLKGDLIEHIYFFESAIDLMSYMSCREVKDNSYLVSLNGVNKNLAIQEILKSKKTLKMVIDCTDNDDAGNNFKAILQDVCKELKIDYFSHSITLSGCKDWNDVVCREYQAEQSKLNPAFGFSKITSDDELLNELLNQ